MMKKYGLSTNVMQTYLADFHGMTASLQKNERSAEGGRVVALCIDCHGVHDIAKTDGPGLGGDAGEPREDLPEVPPGRRRRTSRPRGCRTTSRRSRRRRSSTPSSIGYHILIPFMIGGLVLQILLHLWRVVVNR